MKNRMTNASLTLLSSILMLFSAAMIVDAAPIHDAARQGDLGTVTTILESHPELIELLDEIGASPLWVAAANGKTNVVRALLARGADPTNATIDGLTGLHWAALHGYYDVCVALLDAGADVNARSKIQGNTPLHEVWNGGGQVAVAQLLIERGADIDATEKFYGMTPLHYAAVKNLPDLAAILVEGGASTTIADDRGNAPSSYARSRAMRSILGVDTR